MSLTQTRLMFSWCWVIAAVWYLSVAIYRADTK